MAREEVRRRQLLAKALLVGAGAGAFAAAFRQGLGWLERLRFALPAGHSGLVGVGELTAVGAATGAVAVWMVARFAPETSGSGIPHLKAVVLGDVPFRWRRIIPVKFITGLVGIAGGFALGREGPTIQIGGATGLWVADALHVPVGAPERKTLVSAGAGAGLAAAFNAPLAGMIFVLEELHGSLTSAVFVAAFLASISADIVARVLAGSTAVFALHGVAAPTLSALPLALVVGAAAGLLGVAFNRGIFLSLDCFEGRLRRMPAAVRGAIVGGLSGFAGGCVPGLSGTGSLLVERALGGQFALAVIPVLLATRFVLTVAAYGAGACGGIFLPLLVIGALGGLSMGTIGHLVAPGWIAHPEVFAVVGMGAMFTAIVRAPLTGMVLMIELTGVYDFMLPLLVSCFAAYAVAEALGEPPIYEALRIRRFGATPGVSTQT